MADFTPTDWDNTVPRSPSQLSAPGERPRRFGPSSKKTADHVHQTGDIDPQGSRALRRAMRNWQKGAARKAVREGRDDIGSLNIGATGKKFARMNSKEAFKTTDGTDEKWKTSLKLRAELGGESPSAPMKSKDAVGKVQHAFKETRAQQIVSRMLD